MRELRLGIVTDIHLAPLDGRRSSWHNVHRFGEVRRLLGGAARILTGCEVDLVAVLGDLTDDGDEASLGEVIELLDAIRVPVWLLPGNHDVAPTCVWPSVRALAAARSNIVFAPASRGQVGGFASIISAAVTADDGTFRSHLPPRAAGRHQLILAHFPILDAAPVLAAHHLRFPGNALNREELAGRLRGTAPAVCIHGHLHARLDLVDGNVLQIGCPPLIELPYAVTVIDVRPGHHILEVRTSVIPVVEAFGDEGSSPELETRQTSWRWQGGAWARL